MQQSRPLKIVEVSEPNCDGVFIHVRGLLRYLVAARHRITYLFSSSRSSSQLNELLKELRDSHVGGFDLRISNLPSVADLAAVVHLAKMICLDRPDIVHAHSSKAGALVRMVAAVMPGPTYIYSPHAYYSMAMRPSGGRIVFWWVERLLANLAVTINISRDERRFAVETLGCTQLKGTIIANPVDVDQFKPVTTAERDRARQELGLPSDALLIGTVGRLGAQKDPETLYRAFARLAAQRSDVMLCHLGSGELASQRIAWIAELGLENRVFTIPYLSNPAIFYQALDVFALTSRFEAGWPIVMIEALASGLPLVSTNFVGVGAHERTRLNQAAFVATGDSEAFAQALSSIVDRCLQRAPNNHRAEMERVFSLSRCYGAVESLYLHLGAQPAVI